MHKPLQCAVPVNGAPYISPVGQRPYIVNWPNAVISVSFAFRAMLALGQRSGVDYVTDSDANLSYSARKAGLVMSFCSVGELCSCLASLRSGSRSYARSSCLPHRKICNLYLVKGAASCCNLSGQHTQTLAPIFQDNIMKCKIQRIATNNADALGMMNQAKHRENAR